MSVRLKEFSIIVLIIFLTFLRWEFCLECRLFIWKTFLSYLDFNIENRVTYGKPYICYKNFFFYIFEYFFHPTLFVYIVVFLSQKSFYFTPVPDLFSSSSVCLSLCLSVFFVVFCLDIRLSSWLFEENKYKKHGYFWYIFYLKVLHLMAFSHRKEVPILTLPLYLNSNSICNTLWIRLKWYLSFFFLAISYKRSEPAWLYRVTLSTV